MLKHLVVAALALMTSLAAPAAQAQEDAPWGQSTQEKKAVKEAIARADAALTGARTACGNASMTYRIDWTGYGKVEEQATKDNKLTKPDLYGLGGKLVAGVLDDLATVCADADYKKAATKLKIVTFSPTYTSNVMSSKAQTVTRARTTLAVTYDVATSGGSAVNGIRGVL